MENWRTRVVAEQEFPESAVERNIQSDEEPYNKGRHDNVADTLVGERIINSVLASSTVIAT